MAETLAALIAAHMIADFLAQPNWMVARKTEARGALAHLLVVLGLTAAVLGTMSWGILALGLVHLGIDFIKAGANRRGPLAFLLDQGAHGLSLMALAGAEPQLWANGIWANGIWAALPPGLSLPLPALLALSAGAIAATQMGGFLIALLMSPWEAHARGGLPGGGRMIGLLERALVFTLVLAGQTAALGFLIAAKSVLRFGTVKDDRKASEYVIVGTLASFLWALICALTTAAALSRLSPLGFLPAAP